MTFITLFLAFCAGMFTLLAYMVWRMISSSSWDKSNMTNALRLISHVVVHPNDFGKMYYLTDGALVLLKEKGVKPKQPFWYIAMDELSEVVKTRP